LAKKHRIAREYLRIRLQLCMNFKANNGLVSNAH